MTSAPDRLFQAFADPTRLRLIGLLRGGELCVCDLVEVLGAPQPTVSRHLRSLRDAGLVEARDEGRWRHYRLARASSRLQKALLACVGGCMADLPALKKDAARLAAVKRRKSCP